MDDDANVTPLRLGSQRLYPDEPDPPDDLFFDKPALKSRPAPPPVPPTPQTLPAGPARGAQLASTVLELAGITSLTVGCYLIAPYVGLIVAGLCLVLLGAAMGVNR